MIMSVFKTSFCCNNNNNKKDALVTDLLQSPMTLSSQLESSVWWQTVTWRVTCDYVSVCSVCVLAPGHPAHLSLDSHLHVSFMQFLGGVFVSVCEQTKTVSPKVCHSARYANWEYTFKSGQKRCSYVDTFSLVQVDGEVLLDVRYYE